MEERWAVRTVVDLSIFISVECILLATINGHRMPQGVHYCGNRLYKHKGHPELAQLLTSVEVRNTTET